MLLGQELRPAARRYAVEVEVENDVSSLYFYILYLVASTGVQHR